VALIAAHNLLAESLSQLDTAVPMMAAWVGGETVEAGEKIADRACPAIAGVPGPRLEARASREAVPSRQVGAFRPPMPVLPVAQAVP
jgi:hypothetical protein